MARLRARAGERSRQRRNGNVVRGGPRYAWCSAALRNELAQSIGFPCGPVPEIIVEGETGFLVEDIDRAVEAVGKINQISRARCRREFEQRFTDRHTAEDYIGIYQQLLSRSSTQAAA